LNPYFWRLFIINSGICLQKMHHFGQFSECRSDGRQASILTIIHMQVLYLVLVIEDPWRSCYSACPVLQRRKHFAHREKVSADSRNWPIKLNQQYFELITDYSNNVEGEYQDIQRTIYETQQQRITTFLSFSTRRKWQTWLPRWCYLSTLSLTHSSGYVVDWRVSMFHIADPTVALAIVELCESEGIRRTVS